MKGLKYLIALWTTIAVYSVLSLLYGAMGFSAYEQLLSGRDIQWENMKKLGAINSELENTQNSLLYDRDTIAVYARQLGYGRDDEHFIRIVGLGGEKNPYTAAGEILFSRKTEYIPDKTIKLIALFAGLAVLALLFVSDLLRLRGNLPVSPVR